jgi:STE24 endopeptidase
MNTVAAQKAHPVRWLPALLAAPLAAGAAAALLRPRHGLIEPDPVEASELFTAEEIARARRYGRGQLALAAAGALAQGGLMLALSRRTPPPRRRRALRLRPGRGRGRGPQPLHRAALTAAGLSLAAGAASLPTSALARRRALRVGLATQSWRGWAGDVAKASSIEAAFAAAGGPVAVSLMRRFGERWWVAGTAAALGTGAALAFVAPVVFDPLFNRFEALPDGDLRREILELTQHAGVRVGEIYESDASRRTTAANAYVAGYGATRRVVLWDTLLREFSTAETLLVVAHELAHVRHRDVLGGMVLLAASTPVSAFAVSRLAAALDRSAEPGPGSLAPLALAAGIVGALVAPPAAAYSRRIEARADAFSLALTGQADPFVSFERRIVRQNLADPDPPRLLVAMLGTHPPAVARIGIARAYQRGARPS